MPSVVTANNLRTGEVVYLSREKGWIADLAHAEIAADKETLDALASIARASVERSEVTAVYQFDVVAAGSRPEPVSVREKIRASRAPAS